MFGAFEVFEAWQMARLNAKKKLLMGPWCLCLQGWGAKKAFGGFGGFEAWQTAGLNAKKKLLMWPWCLGLRGCRCQKGVWSVWRVALVSLPAGFGVPKRHLEGLECLRPGKRQV